MGVEVQFHALLHLAQLGALEEGWVHPFPSMPALGFFFLVVSPTTLSMS